MVDAPVDIARTGEGLIVTMPVAHNRWIVGLGFGVAVPWVALFTIGSVVVPVLAPAATLRTAVLGVIAVNLLFGIVHVLAVIGIWLAAYEVRGTEQAIVTSERFVMRRRAMGVSVPIRLGRTVYDAVELLDPARSPGKVAHPRLEVRAGHSAVRFGAGLSAEEARLVRDVLAEEFRQPRL